MSAHNVVSDLEVAGPTVASGGSALGDSEQEGPAALQPEPAPEAAQVVLRRRAWLSGVVGALAGGVALAYALRAGESGRLLDWSVFVMMAMIATVFLRGLLDARLPLLVVDELGIRIRLANQWRGFPWEAVDSLEVTPRRSLFADGQLSVRLLHVQRALEGIDSKARRHAQWNRRLYGATLAVPLGLTTRVTGLAGEDLQDRLTQLSAGKADVLVVVASPNLSQANDEVSFAEGELVHLSGLAHPEARAASYEEPAALVQAETEREEAALAPTTDPEPEVPAERVLVIGEPEALSSNISSGTNVRPLATIKNPVSAPVIDGYATEPAYDPIIGPELAAARRRIGLSIDELSELTRIRPHVIEALEVDDFGPAGGDFYVRGHLRTMCRVLGKDAEPLLDQFAKRYASGPVSPKTVFEAELAAGGGGAMRHTPGGANWTLMIGVVLVVILLWTVARLFTGVPAENLSPPPPMLNGSAGLDNGFGAAPQVRPAAPRPTVSLTAVNAGISVEVRDGEGALVFQGDLVIGETQSVQASYPISVSTDNAGALSVSIDGKDRGTLGRSVQPGTKVFQGT